MRSTWQGDLGDAWHYYITRAPSTPRVILPFYRVEVHHGGRLVTTRYTLTRRGGRREARSVRSAETVRRWHARTSGHGTS